MGAFLLMLVFTGFFAALQFALHAATDSKARTGAVALTQAKIEYLRSIPYDDVGVLWADNNRGHGNDDDGYDEDNPGHGGTIGDNYEFIAAVYENITLNKITYVRRTLIVYADDPADGLGGGHDDNHNTHDYKLVTVEVSWTSHGKDRMIKAITTIAPDGVEQ